MKMVWIIFTLEEKNTFPNFIPIGAYSSSDLALKQIETLPKSQDYQLFEIPIDQFFGEITVDGRVRGALGRLNHSHY